MDAIVEQVAAGAEPEQILEQTLSLPRGELETLVGQLGRLKRENAARLLTQLLDKTSDKKLQKLIRKAIFQLKTQGISVGEPDRKGESVLRKTETIRESRALLSSYDPDQTRAMVMAFELKKNEFLFSQAIIHFSKGLLDLKSASMGRSDLDALMEEYISRVPHPVMIASIAPPYAGYLLEEAAAVSGNQSDDARSLSGLLYGFKGDVRKPSDIYHLSVPSDVVSAPIDLILYEEVFGAFSFTWGNMEEDRKRLAKAVNPSLVLPQHMIEERKEAFLTELAEDERIIFTLPSLKRMLEDMAYLFYNLKRFDRFKGLIETTADPQSMKRVIRYFLKRTLDELDKKEQEQKSDLLVDPRSLIRK
jgi:hypothetical protein